MKTNEILREQIFEIIDNQISGNNPPETKVTLERLRKQGYNVFQAKQMIGSCLAVELFDIMKNGEPFNNERYVQNLGKLPKEPFED